MGLELSATGLRPSSITTSMPFAPAGDSHDNSPTYRCRDCPLDRAGFAFGRDARGETRSHLETFQTRKESKGRGEAVKEITELGQLSANFSKQAVPGLRKALKDKDVRVRAAAATAVGQIDPQDKKEVVDDLINLLKEDKDESVREGAASGLGALGPAAEDALPALREARDKATGKRDRVYTAAMQAIGGRKK